MKFKQFLDEKITPDQPVSRNQVRMALMKAHINPMKASEVARKLQDKQLGSPSELAKFFKQEGLRVEQTMDLIKYLWKINEELEQQIFEEISHQQLNYAEDIIDALWSKLGIDVKFSKHFFQRINDSRNEKEITVDELIALFKKEYQEHGHVIKTLDDNDEAVMKDLFSKLNIPFAMNKSGEDKEIVAKTIMRKPTFHTSSKEFPVK